MSKFYIQIVLFLLNIFVYVNNETLAANPAPRKVKSPKLNIRCSTPEEIYEQNKHLLCTDPKEIKNAVELMNEAVIHLVYHATNKDGYELCKKDNSCNMISYKKKHDDHTNVEKTEYIVSGSNNYSEIITNIWNPDHLHFFEIISVKKGTTVFVMISANINDQNPSNKEYKNTIIEKANLFKTDIDSENDIIKGRWKKTFVNISGYLIEKKDECVDITFVESMDEHDSIYHMFKNALS
ncbi:fam-a protein [Plasmodium vinckei brucechwatti]|uniref:Fam-a protein n=1 Tax=Plasmodium vinckei brucechwatti TaxID=119398 RepID=A0A6V7RSY3_PLAVN|nr:fam-a protein [Plasmodium vinckei brucechwatti]